MRYILQEIETERLHQIAEGYTTDKDAKVTSQGWLVTIIRHLGLGCNDGGSITGKRWRKQLLRVGALIVAAIQSYDANNPRELDNTHRGKGF